MAQRVDLPQRIDLQRYKAKLPGVPEDTPLELGTYGSYGIEQLRLNPDARWDGLTIAATFVPPGGDPVRVVVGPDNLLDVPPEATAVHISKDNPGAIVFSGVADGVQRISCNLKYFTGDHKPIEGKDSTPTPSEWEQYVTQLKGVVDKAVPPDGEPGQVLTKGEGENFWTYPTGGGGGGGYTIGDGLKYDPESNILSVNTADVVEKDNTLPITSAAVYTTVGNIEALLETI